MMTPTQSRRYGRMVRDFTSTEAKAYNDHLLAGKRAEDFFAKMEKQVALEKPKSVYVIPPLMKAVDDDYNPLAKYTKTAHVALGRSLGIKAGEFITEKHQQGKHDQATHGNWAGDRFSPDSVKSARDGAKEYAFKNGIKQDDDIEYDEVVANRARASKIADAYDKLPKFDKDAVDEYEALATEVEQQYDYMTKTLGIKVEFILQDPYKTSKEMFAEVSTGKLRVLRTESTGAHPLFSNEQNDKFRAVHDYFGHAATGRGFGQDGEEAAWVHHSQMFGKKARGALTTETRGQNSWYNTRKNGFADQKVALLPEQYWEVPAVFAKHLAGQHDQSSHGSWAEGIAEKISLKTAGLKDQGVTQKFLVDNSTVSTMKIYENLEEIAKRVASELEDVEIEDILTTDGFQMTSQALEFGMGREAGYADGDSYISVLTTSEGNTAGAMAVSIKANDNGEPITEMHYLGTTGIVDGAGSMLYGQAINYAYKNKTGLQLLPLNDAVPFWESMGFKKNLLLNEEWYLEMSAQEVEAIWKELTIVESAMPNA
jgi:hypothetical protein